MVMDQCKDHWTSWSDNGSTPQGNCVTGHLDFDVYPIDHDVGHLQARAAEHGAGRARVGVGARGQAHTLSCLPAAKNRMSGSQT